MVVSTLLFRDMNGNIKHMDAVRDLNESMTNPCYVMQRIMVRYIYIWPHIWPRRDWAKGEVMERS